MSTSDPSQRPSYLGEKKIYIKTAALADHYPDPQSEQTIKHDLGGLGTAASPKERNTHTACNQMEQMSGAINNIDATPITRHLPSDIAYNVQNKENMSLKGLDMHNKMSDEMQQSPLSPLETSNQNLGSCKSNSKIVFQKKVTEQGELPQTSQTVYRPSQCGINGIQERVEHDQDSLYHKLRYERKSVDKIS